MPYVVKANLHGKRIASKIYQNKVDALDYAHQTNKIGWAKNARVKKI